MYHSINFGDKNTWDDWQLIPMERPVVAAAPVKTSYVDIPGGNGSIDLTTALTGAPCYGDRTGSWEFAVVNCFDRSMRFERFDNISNYLHGQRMRIVLEDDPNFYYEGRFSVEDKPGSYFSTIIFTYTLDPFKKELNETTQKAAVTNSTKVMQLRREVVPLTPILSVPASSNVTVKLGNSVYALRPGTTTALPDSYFRNGSRTMVLEGQGEVTIKYRGGAL